LLNIPAPTGDPGFIEGFAVPQKDSTEAVLEARWTVENPTALLWAGWEEEYSIYDRISGETHLLKELPAEILRQLSKTPRTGAEVASSVASLIEMPDTEDWRSKIASLIADLDNLGLICKES
jgi:PqqD family protein of HPr-rel-A system